MTTPCARRWCVHGKPTWTTGPSKKQHRRRLCAITSKSDWGNCRDRTRKFLRHPPSVDGSSAYLAASLRASQWPHPGTRRLLARLRGRQKSIDDRQEIRGLLVAGIVAQPRHRHDLDPGQCLLQLLLRFRRNDVTRAARNTDDGRLDPAHGCPQLGGNKPIQRIGNSTIPQRVSLSLAAAVNRGFRAESLKDGRNRGPVTACGSNSSCPASGISHSGGPRAGALRGGDVASPKCARMPRTATASVMKAMMRTPRVLSSGRTPRVLPSGRISPPHRGHRNSLIDASEQQRPTSSCGEPGQSTPALYTIDQTYAFDGLPAVKARTESNAYLGKIVVRMQDT